MKREIKGSNLPEEAINWRLAYTRALSDPDVLLRDIPNIREHLKEYDWDEGIRENDIWLLEDLKEILKANPAIEDDDSQPLEKWWWHLHKIAEGTYPKDMLPQYLRNLNYPKDMESSTKSIELNIDKEALENGFITLEAKVENYEELDEDTLEELEDKYLITGQLILTKDYELIFLDHAVINPSTLDKIKELPIKGKYSIPELNIYNVSFKDIIEKLKRI